MRRDEHRRAYRHQRQRSGQRAVPDEPRGTYQATDAAGRCLSELEARSRHVLTAITEIEHHHSRLVVAAPASGTDIVPGAFGGVLGENGTAGGEAGLAPGRSIQRNIPCVCGVSFLTRSANYCTPGCNATLSDALSLIPERQTLPGG